MDGKEKIKRRKKNVGTAENRSVYWYFRYFSPRFCFFEICNSAKVMVKEGAPKKATRLWPIRGPQKVRNSSDP